MKQPENEEQVLKKYYLIDFAKLSKMVIRDLNKNNNTSPLFRKYNKEDVIKFLENPEKSEKQLRNISNYLYNNSSHYKRSILYFSLMPTLDYVVNPIKLDTTNFNERMFMQAYRKTLEMLDNMNIKHEFKKAMTIAFINDVFYGYEHETDDSYFLQSLDPNYCSISSIDDGCYNFQFDFSYFDKYKELLDNYPEEFQRKYKIYQSDKKKRWQELDSKKTCCIKINEEITYPIPFFAGAFPEIFDIENYKQLRNAREEMENYALLIEKIGLKKDSDTANDFLLELDTAIDFHNKAASTLPPQVGLMLSPFESVDVVNFNKNRSTDKDIVADVERDYYSAIGINQLLFSSPKTGSIGLSNSILVDQEIVFGVLRQIERWINRKLKFRNNKYNFEVKILNITWFNQKDYVDQLLKNAQYGVPVKTELFSALGNSPAYILNKAYVENTLLGILDTWKPLQSSHTGSNNSVSEGGRPTKQGDVSDNTEIGRDLESNDNRSK